jgi:Zn-dependent protease with chaperone function
VLFMIKPLFARRGKAPNLMTLRRDQEPLLFSFVDRLCDLVGAARPRKINVDCQVNASASFGGGLLSLFGRNLVLTIGLPLVAGLNLRQLTGVLAHEFGHFAQGTAMRVSYIVRTINMWFARVVYERDHWDEQLESWAAESGSAGIAIVLWITKLMVWVTRRILWVLMMIGHGVSCFLLRQMEFDADRYEARVAGSDVFAQTCRALPVLSVASDAAFSDIGHAWQERRLPDDIPGLVMYNARQMPGKVLEKIDKVVCERGTGWFDTHPADRDRIDSAARENTPGVFTAEVPATVLFSDFAGLSRQTSALFYREILGPKFEQAAVITTDSLQQSHTGQVESHKALRRIFQDRLKMARPVFLGQVAHSVEGDEALAQRLTDARSRMNDLLAAIDDAAAKRLDDADEALIKAQKARALLSAGMKKVRAEDFGLASGDQLGVSHGVTTAQEDKRLAQQPFDRLEAPAVERLEAAINLARSPRIAPQISGVDLPQLERVLATLGAFRNAYPVLFELRDRFMCLAAVLENLQQNQGNEGLINAAKAICASLVARLRELHDAWGETPYPFEHAQAGLKLGDYVVDGIPPSENLGELIDTCNDVLERGLGLYYRAMGVVAVAVERVESVLRLPPGQDPPEKEEEESPEAEQ